MKIVVEVDGVNPCDDMPRIIGEMLEARSPGIMVSCCEFDDEPLKERIRELEDEVAGLEDERDDAESELAELEEEIEELREELSELKGYDQ